MTLLITTTHPIKLQTANCDLQLGCPSQAWPGPSSSAERGRAVVRVPRTRASASSTVHVSHVPQVSLKARHPLSTRFITY